MEWKWLAAVAAAALAFPPTSQGSSDNIMDQVAGLGGNKRGGGERASRNRDGEEGARKQDK